MAAFLEQPLLLPALTSASRHNSSYCLANVPVPDQRYTLHALPVRRKWSMAGVLTYGQSLEWMYPSSRSISIFARSFMVGRVYSS